MDGHMLIVGPTQCGKTTFAKRLAGSYAKRGVASIVLDPLKDPDWPTQYRFDNSGAFFNYVRNPHRCKSCALFVDESGIALSKYDDALLWLTTTSRHHGHRAHLIAQRAEMVNKTIRSQCTTLVAFQINKNDAAAYASDWNCEDILSTAPRLARGQYMVVSRFNKPTYHQLWKNK
jgi:GTPase SAR1 family protein